jgi:hypothetical protein
MEPDPYPELDPYLRLRDPDADTGGPKTRMDPRDPDLTSGSATLDFEVTEKLLG